MTRAPKPSGGALSPGEVEALSRKAALLTNALYGIMAGAAPPGGPCDEDEEMFPVWELAMQISVAFRRLKEHGYDRVAS